MKKPTLLMFVFLVVILLPPDLSIGEQYYSCSDGKRGACLDYGDTVCSSGSKCVDDDTVCFDSYTCRYKGFVCKSKYDDLVVEYNTLSVEYNTLSSKCQTTEMEYDNLENKYRSLKDCVSSANSLEDAHNCTL